MTLYSDPLWAELLSVTNIVLGLSLAWTSYRQWRRSKDDFLRLTSFLRVFVGAYWAGIYLFVLFTPGGSYDPVWFGRIFVRPAFTFTLGLIGAIALYRYKADKIDNE